MKSIWYFLFLATVTHHARRCPGQKISFSFDKSKDEAVIDPEESNIERRVKSNLPMLPAHDEMIEKAFSNEKSLESDIIISESRQDSNTSTESFIIIPDKYQVKPTKITIGMMAECDPMSSERCTDFPRARCMEHTVEGAFKTVIFLCQCDYQHTAYLSDGEIKCFLNVFSPCTRGAEEFDCGENMICKLDTLHLTTDKFCRCLPGFAPVDNEHGIPAYCRPLVPNNSTEATLDEGANRGCHPKILSRPIIFLLCYILRVLNVINSS